MHSPKTLGMMTKRIAELGSRYYVGSDGEVMLFWNGTWRPYHFVAQKDKRFALEEFSRS